MKRTLISLALLGLCSCAFAQLITKKESQEINRLLDSLSANLRHESYIFRNVTVITMKDSITLLNHDVLIERGLIKKIGKNLPADSTVLEIEARGKYLLPGLIDMHAHLFPHHPMINTWKIHFLLTGVTSIRDMNGVPGKKKLELRDAIIQNKVFAPTLYQASQPIDSRKSSFFQLAKTSEDGKRLVREAKQLGFDFIKVYDGLTPDVYHAIIEEAGSLQLPVVGHIPSAITLEEALEARQNSIEHLIGYFEWKGVTIQLTTVPDYAEKTAQSATWVCPTLYNHHLNLSRASAQSVLKDSVARLLPKGLYDNWLKRTNDQSKNVVEMVDKQGARSFDVLQGIVQSLYKANSKLIAGTDAGNLPFLIPGSSLIEELKLLSQNGIPKYNVLRMATCDAARSMGKQKIVGTIEEGLRADLILLERNPMETLNNLYANSGVMVRGCWISKADRNRISTAMKKIFNR